MVAFQVTKIDNGFLFQSANQQTGEQQNVACNNDKALLRQIRTYLGMKAHGRPKAVKYVPTEEVNQTLPFEEE